MLDNIESIFDKKEKMMRKLKKASYDTFMAEFRQEHGHYFTEMTEYLSLCDDKEKAAAEIADVFTEKVKSAYTVNGKIKGKTQVDLNFFMIYYVFPAILLTEHEDASKIADAIRDAWHDKFKDSNIGYTSYEKLRTQFREKIFGIF